MRTVLLLILVSFFSLTSFAARAQDVFASAVSLDNETPTAVEKVTLSGKITNAAGPLPGAVVILTGTNQMAATDANGEFEFTVPANAGTLNAVVTYAGYADEKMVLNTEASESTTNLSDARVVVVSRKQQLKKYLKTARKQVAHDLKQVRKG